MVLGVGQGSFTAATAAGGRPPTPATAYQPRQTRPRTSLGSIIPPISLRSSTVKTLALSSSSKLPMLSTAALDAALQETMSFMSFRCRGCYLHPHTLVPLKSLGLDSQRVKKLALKFHAHSVHYAHKLVQTRCSFEYSPHLQTNQERSAGLSACNPPDPH